MNITSVKTGGFANGFSYFCLDCGRFFSAQFMKQFMDADGEIEAEWCPNCGGGDLITGADILLDYCFNTGSDPVNFYHAFPPDEPIPNSRTGATPRQVEWIVGCVISDKQKKFPVTAESLAGQLGYDKEIVVKVFEELYITETGGAV